MSTNMILSDIVQESYSTTFEISALRNIALRSGHQHAVLATEGSGGNLQTGVKVARILSLGGRDPGPWYLGAGIVHLVGPVVTFTQRGQCQGLSNKIS